MAACRCDAEFAIRRSWFLSLPTRYEKSLACPECSGLGSVHEVTEQTLVPDPSLSIRDGAVAAWPGAWHGKNMRDILTELGHDIDRPWRDIPAQERDWILFTDEQPEVTVHPVRGPG